METPVVETPAVEEVPVPASEIDTWLSDQGLTEVSEDDLRGYEDQEEEKEEEKEEKPEVTPAEPVTPEPVPPKAEEKPPKGFVPTQAVKEAREENRYLKEQLKTLQDAVEALKKAPAPVAEAPGDTFKELTKAEYLELAEESPKEAMAYLLELQEHKERIREQKLQEQKQAETASYVTRMLAEAQEAVEKVAPGIFDEASTVQAELVEFAEELGFTEDLFYLTNPETLIILPGETTPSYLGKQAAKILSVIVNAKKLGGAKPDETELRKQIEAEVITKLKTLAPGKTFKSLADLPTSAPVKIKAAAGVLSEAEMAKLSPDELKQYLTGEEV